MNLIHLSIKKMILKKLTTTLLHLLKQLININTIPALLLTTIRLTFSLNTQHIKYPIYAYQHHQY